MLIFRFKRGLATNAGAAASTIRHDVADTCTAVSDTRRNMLKHPGDAHSQDQAVSTVRTPPVAERPLNTLPRLTLG